AGWADVPFGTYDREVTRRRLLPAGGGAGDVELVVERFHEVAESRRTLSEAAAVEEAAALARQRLQAQMPRAVRVLRENVDVVLRTPARVGVRLVVEAEESLGEVAPIRASEDAPQHPDGRRSGPLGRRGPGDAAHPDSR
ncbi:MAG: sporulation protein YqfD, partial [Clostridia bacterium]|nr:sporulation protein YqfD [Clostridia bacterium]